MGVWRIFLIECGGCLDGFLRVFRWSLFIFRRFFGGLLLAGWCLEGINVVLGRKTDFWKVGIG